MERKSKADVGRPSTQSNNESVDMKYRARKVGEKMKGQTLSSLRNREFSFLTLRGGRRKTKLCLMIVFRIVIYLQT